MARPATGTMVPGPNGEWMGRITVRKPDGTTVRPWCDLLTADKDLAAKKLAAIVKEAKDDPARVLARLERPKPVAAGPPRFEPYADTWRLRRERDGVAMAESEKGWLKNHVNPCLVGDAQVPFGSLALTDIRPRHIREVLEKAREHGLSRQTLVHLRGTIVRILHRAFMDEIIPENPALKTEVPNMREVKKIRAVLTDEEFIQFIDCPDVDLELRVMGVSARCEGGMRTRDVTAWTWDMVDTKLFAYCTVPRTKSGQPQKLDIPDLLQVELRRWWLDKGRPTSGPIFPVRRGKRKGEARRRRGVSFADRLRQALKIAGLDRLELFEESDTTLPVDFHSFRRAFATALDDADVPERQAMDLADQADARTRKRYTKHAKRARHIPVAAIPRRPVSSRVSSETSETSGTARDHADFERDTGLEPATLSLGSRCRKTASDGNDSGSRALVSSGIGGDVAHAPTQHRGEASQVAHVLDTVEMLDRTQWNAMDQMLFDLGGLDAFFDDEDEAPAG